MFLICSARSTPRCSPGRLALRRWKEMVSTTDLVIENALARAIDGESSRSRWNRLASGALAGSI